jgi:hypothetical protein
LGDFLTQRRKGAKERRGFLVNSGRRQRIKADKRIGCTLIPVYLLPANGKVVTAENYQEDQGCQGCQGCQVCECYGLALLVFAKYFGGGVKIYGEFGGEWVIDFGK